MTTLQSTVPTCHVIEYDLAFYKVTQDIFEPDDVFYDRVWYICNGMATDTDANFETLVKKSRMRAAIKQYGCEYKSDVMSHVLTD